MNKISIYTKDGCPSCVKTKMLLTTNSIEFEEFEIGRNVTREEVLQKFPSAKTVPIIVIDDSTVVGGYTDLLRLYENRELFTLLGL